MLNNILQNHNVISITFLVRMDDLTQKNIIKRKKFAKSYLKREKVAGVLSFSDESNLIPTKYGKKGTEE